MWRAEWCRARHIADPRELDPAAAMGAQQPGSEQPDAQQPADEAAAKSLEDSCLALYMAAECSAPMSAAPAPVEQVEQQAPVDPAPWRGADNAAARARVYAVHVRTAAASAGLAPEWFRDGLTLRRPAGRAIDAALRRLPPIRSRWHAS